MPVKKKAKKPSIYQIKVTLLGSKPPIWRRFQVESDITLGDLHPILQEVMGWGDSHLHQFIIDQKYYGIPMPGEMFDWLGEDFNPEEFDLNMINKSLPAACVRPRSRDMFV